jgi:putative oxidoreductase
MRVLIQRLIAPTAPGPAAIIRLMVGAVFLLEGVQKFLYPGDRGAGRLANMGFPAPEILGPFVGVVEITCGAMVLLGLLTRLAVIPLIIDMTVAIVSTKIPILLGRGFWGFSLRELDRYGFWELVHETRTDWSMLLGSLFLLVVGSDRFTMDRVLHRAHAHPTQSGR